MFEVIRREIILASLKHCLKHPAPVDMFENSEHHYLAYLNHKKENYTLVVDSLGATQVSGRFYVDKELNKTGSIPIHTLPDYSIEVMRRFRGHSTYYRNWFRYAASEIFQLKFIPPLLEKYRQGSFDRTTRFTHQRIELLKRIFIIHLEAADQIQEPQGALFSELESYDEFDLFIKVYGERVVGHPRFNREFTNFKLLLETLVGADDLSVDDDKYALGAHAIRTISEFDDQEQRHSHNKLHNRALLWLTLVLAASAVIKVWRS